MDSQLILFILTSVLIILTPGQDMMIVLSRALGQGVRAGVICAAGISIGLLGHTLIAAVGLGALLRSSQFLFVSVKLLGAAYLVYLGAKLLMSKPSVLVLEGSTGETWPKIFLTGVVSNLSNPKIVIFYLAYLPQFVPSGAESMTGSLLFLGSVFALLTFVIKAPIGVGAGLVSVWVRSRPAILLWVNRLSGGVLVLLGLKLVLERRV